jgi:hypothetical protein
MWCNGGHLHTDCPEKQTTRPYDMLQLQACGRRETPSVQLPRLQPRQGRDPQTKAQRTPKNITGRVFSSNYTSGLSFAAVLRNNVGQQQQPHPNVLWKILQQYGIPNKLLNIVETLYHGFQVNVVHNGMMSDHITTEAGIRQGCILSPILFLIVMDWVMKRASEGKQKYNGMCLSSWKI